MPATTWPLLRVELKIMMSPDNLSYSYAGNRLQAVSDNSWYKKPGDALADDFARADRTVKDNVTP